MYKIQIKNIDESYLVQDILFSMGHSWISTGKNYNHLDAKFIGVWDDTYLTYGDTVNQNYIIYNLEQFLTFLENDFSN